MSPSERALQKFLALHPRIALDLDETGKLLYRAGYADGALDMLAKLEDAIKPEERKVSTDV